MGTGLGDTDLVVRAAAELLGDATAVVADVDLGVEWLPGNGLVAAAAEYCCPPGPVQTWPEGGVVVRLYGGDVVAASEQDRLALRAQGRAFRVVPGPTADTVAAAQAASCQTLALAGRTIVVTRAAAVAAGMATALRRHGASVIAFPTIAFAPPSDGGVALRRAVAELDRYAWLVVTSANGANAVLAELGDARRLAGVQVAAIGPATAAALAAAHLQADLVPPDFVAESLLAVFPPPPAPTTTQTTTPTGAPGVRGRVLVARAEVARDVLPAGLAQAGWPVDVVPAYRTVAAAVGPVLRRAVSRADVVTFTSPSTVQRFIAEVGVDAVPPVVACIGPVTAAAATAAGLSVAVQAATYTVDGLVAALVEALAG